MGRLLNTISKNKPKLPKTATLRKKGLALVPLKLKRAVGTPIAVPVVQYRTFTLNKSYLISTLPTHTWTYTSPDFIVGSYIRMVSGVFMQKGSMLTMLKLFRGFKDLTGPVLSAHSDYKIVEPSFSAQISPLVFSFKKTPLHLSSYLSTATSLKKLGGAHPLPPCAPYFRITGAVIPNTKVSPKPKKGSKFLNLRRGSLAHKFIRPKMMLKATSTPCPSLSFNTRRANLSYPKQNSLAI
jgi:hypothetical protein